jgi:hypothetical protein
VITTPYADVRTLEWEDRLRDRALGCRRDRPPGEPRRDRHRCHVEERVTAHCPQHRLGYDMGDDHAHVTTNISPEVAEATIDFFFTSEIQSISDLASGAPLA